MVMAVLLPAWGRAQTRIGAAPEAGLGAAAAPAPTMSASALPLAPATLSAAGLSPALAAPAPLLAVSGPAIMVQPTAAKPVAFVAAAPQALAAIKPAAAPDKPGSEQARAAGTALFDGAAGLASPAAGDGAFVPESAPEARRTSGLSPPTDAEIKSAYRRAQPKSNAVNFLGSNFVAEAGGVIQRYTFIGEDFLEGFQARGRGQMDSRRREIFQAVGDLVRTHDAREHAPSRTFTEMLGRWFAFKDHPQMLRDRGTERFMPPSPIARGEYWDMAAGMNAAGYIYHELEPNMNYTFFDYSPFAVSYLKTAVELSGAKNASIVEGDINKLTKPAKPLAMLRTKNAIHYVPGFDKKLEEMSDWIAPGGQLAIQNDPGPGQRILIVDKHGPLIRRLISEGWALEYGFSGARGKFSDYGFDTLILIRPTFAQKKTAQETARIWSAYSEAVRLRNAEYNPFFAMFR